MLHIREKGRNLWDLRNGLQSPTTFAFLLAQNRCFLLICKKEKVLNLLEIQDFALFCFLDKWYQRESNLRHTDFQSVALPTELWYQSIFAFASAKIIKISLQSSQKQNYTTKKFKKGNDTETIELFWSAALLLFRATASK